MFTKLMSKQSSSLKMHTARVHDNKWQNRMRIEKTKGSDL